MPFTFSHPAIVLPFCKSKKIQLSITGLIMGSIVPDMEFLFQLRETDIFGHTWLGIIWFDIPVAIILCFVFHVIVRNALVINLPKQIRQRFTSFIPFNWGSYFNQNKLRVLISVVIGIFSHLFLDSFTHKYGHIANTSKLFFYKLSFLNYHVPVFMVLQIAFSLFGALYILLFILRMKKESGVEPANNILGYWTSFFITAILIIALRFIIYNKHQSTADIVIAITGSFVYALLIISCYYFRLYRNKKSLHN
ncbi:MAG: DUF4184 family protein [Ferruginibacter sp.]